MGHVSGNGVPVSYRRLNFPQIRIVDVQMGVELAVHELVTWRSAKGASRAHTNYRSAARDWAN